MELVVLTTLPFSFHFSVSLSIFLPALFLSLSLLFLRLHLSPSLSLSLSLPLSLLNFPVTMDSKAKAKNEVMMMDADNDDVDEREDDSDSKKKRPASAASSAAKKGSGGLSPPSCQAEKCSADLTDAKRYHRRHKVCELHAKAPFVIVAGLRQRFCQQCSRFHELLEFDDTKRSCRRRLAGHNERRRKNSTESNMEGSSRGGAGQESHCRQADQSGRMPIALPSSPTYKHFQIR